MITIKDYKKIDIVRNASNIIFVELEENRLHPDIREINIVQLKVHSQKVNSTVTLDESELNEMIEALIEIREKLKQPE